MTTQSLTCELRPSPMPRVAPSRRVRQSPSVRHLLQIGGSLAVLTTLLVVVLPSVTGASWDSAVRAMSLVSLPQLAALTALWLVGLWAYSFVLAASLPGLTKGQGLVLNLVGSGVSNLVPFGGALGVGATWTMARQYGFSHRSIGLFTGVSGIWNLLARLALPVAGLAALIMVGAQVSGSVLWAAGAGAALSAVVVALVVAALGSERVAARLIAAAVSAVTALAGLIGRSAPQGFGSTLATQRESAVELLKRGRGGLVGGMLSYLVLQGVLMWACLAVVGSGLGWAEITAGYALGRMLTTVVLTPGGTGFAETGTAAALIALGGDPATTVAGVLLFSFFTFVCEIPGGALAYLWHLGARHWHRPAPRPIRGGTG